MYTQNSYSKIKAYAFSAILLGVVLIILAVILSSCAPPDLASYETETSTIVENSYSVDAETMFTFGSSKLVRVDDTEFDNVCYLYISADGNTLFCLNNQ